MKKIDQVTIENTTIQYQIDYGKRKHLYIVVKNGLVIVRAPRRTSLEYIQKVVLDKQKWILDKLSLSSAQPKIPLQYKEGEEFAYLGDWYRLDIIYEQRKDVKVEFYEKKLYVILPFRYKDKECSELIKKKINNYYKELAGDEIRLSLKRISEQTELVPNMLTIKQMKSSFGRCSSNGNISMNVELVKYKRDIIDYVMLHEICHLKHMNHSKDFWSMVAFYMPDYKDRMKVLKSR